MVDKREIVRKFLCMPVVKSNKKGIIRITENDKIETSQSYKSHFDPDMSDVAVEFYKILYGIEELLKQEKPFEFAGDTICSFNTIANRVPGAGKSKKQRTKYNCWPDYLQKYCDFYHCLANFWILPSPIGRSYPGMKKEYWWASKTGPGEKEKKEKIDDYMDRFLLFIRKEDNYRKLKEQYPKYGGKFENYDRLIEKHYLVGENNFVFNDKITLFSEHEESPEHKESPEKIQESPEKIVEGMTSLIKGRAKAISESDEIMPKLYELYDRCKNKGRE